MASFIYRTRHRTRVIERPHTSHLFVHAMGTPPDSFIGRQSEEVQVADFSKENKKWPKNEVSGSGAPLIVKPDWRVRVGMRLTQSRCAAPLGTAWVKAWAL